MKIIAALGALLLVSAACPVASAQGRTINSIAVTDCGLNNFIRSINANHTVTCATGGGSGSVAGVNGDIQVNSSNAPGALTPAAGVSQWISAPSSANFLSLLTTKTGTGLAVFNISPVLTTPNLGTPSAANLVNATGLPIAGISGLAANVGTFLGAPSSANFLASLTSKSGTGLAVFNVSPSVTGLTLADVTGSTQCLHTNNLGTVSGTGSDCGAGGGGGSITVTDGITPISGTTQLMADATAFKVSGSTPNATLSSYCPTGIGNLGDANASISTAKAKINATLTASRVYTMPAAASFPNGCIQRTYDEARTVSSSNTVTLARAGSDLLNNGTSFPPITAAGFWIDWVSDGVSKWTEVNSGTTRPLQAGEIYYGNSANLTAAGVPTGDVVPNSSNVWTIPGGTVTNAKLATAPAHTHKGNNTGSIGAVLDLTVAQLTADLNVVVGDSGSGGTKGLVPAPAAGDAAAGKYLSAGGVYSVPAGGGGGGTPGGTSGQGQWNNAGAFDGFGWGTGFSLDTTNKVLNLENVLNDQSGGNYTVLTADASKTISVGAHAYTLPQAGSTGFPAKWSACFLNVGTGGATLSTTTSVFKGAGDGTSLTIRKYDFACPTSDGTDWPTFYGFSGLGYTQNALLVGGGNTAAPSALGSIGASTTLLHGGSPPSFGAVSLTADVSGVLPKANGGCGSSTGAGCAVNLSHVYTIFNDFTAHSTSSTTETKLASCPIPGGVPPAGSAIRVSGFLSRPAAQSGTATFSVKYGGADDLTGTTLQSSSPTTTQHLFNFSMQILNRTTSSQRSNNTAAIIGSTSLPVDTTVNTTAPSYVVLSGLTASGGSDSIVLESLNCELLPPGGG
jgi:hypothetical protein